MVSKYPGQRLSLQNIFLHKWVRKYYYESMLGSRTADLENRTQKKKEEENELDLHRSQSEILDFENDLMGPLPTDRTTEAKSCQTKYVFEPPKNKFVNTSDYMASKVSVSTNDPQSFKKCASEHIHASLQVSVQFKDNMNLNSVSSNHPKIIFKAAFIGEFTFPCKSESKFLHK